MEKREKTWQSMSISNEVFDKLDTVRERTEREMGMKLSWTKFFSHLLRDLERPVLAKPQLPTKSAASGK
jgi:uncharacterized protein YllA (UPF0747 family)